MGEYETFVLSCPMFKEKKIEILNSEKHWDKKTRSGYLVADALVKKKTSA